VRQPRLVWNDVPIKGLVHLAQRLRRPTTDFGDGWWLQFYANPPGAFHRLPERMRVRAVRTALGPVGAWWLKERVLGQLPVLTGHTVVSAEADGSRLRLRVHGDDGRVIDQTTQHLIAGTGYGWIWGRLPFLATSYPGAHAVVQLRGVGSGPVLRRVGVRAQLRAGHAVSPRRGLQRPPPRQSRPGQGDRGAIPGAGRAVTHRFGNPVTVRPPWRTGACNAYAGPIVLTVDTPPASPVTPLRLERSKGHPVQPPHFLGGHR
jgi:hypothetical protein